MFLFRACENGMRLSGVAGTAPSFCWNCGAPLGQSQRYCGKCGKALGSRDQRAASRTGAQAFTAARPGTVGATSPLSIVRGPYSYIFDDGGIRRVAYHVRWGNLIAYLGAGLLSAITLEIIGWIEGGNMPTNPPPGNVELILVLEFLALGFGFSYLLSYGIASRRRRNPSFEPRVLRSVDYNQVKAVRIKKRTLSVQSGWRPWKLKLKQDEVAQVVKYLSGKVPSIETSS